MAQTTKFRGKATVAAIPLNVFFHWAWAVDSGAGTLTCYINGNVASSTFVFNISTWPNTDATGSLYIGSDTVTFGNLSLDDLRIYKSALTQAQVSAIYAGGVGKKYVLNETPTASAAWNMDEGTGTTITDAQNGLVGTLSATGVTWQSGGVPFASGGGGAELVSPTLNENWGY